MKCDSDINLHDRLVSIGGGVEQCPRCSATFDTGQYPRDWNGYVPDNSPATVGARRGPSLANVAFVILLIAVVLVALTHGNA